MINKAEKMVNMLGSGWYTLNEIADKLQISYSEIRKTLTGIKGDFKLIRMPDKVDKRKVYFHIAR